MRGLCCCGGAPPEFSDGEVEDDDAEPLSYVGMAVYEVLRTRYHRQHHSLWNVTSGKVIGQLHHTPLSIFQDVKDPAEGHSDWFPSKMGEIIARTERWCDIMSLGPPDGLFIEKFCEALTTICERAATSERKIVVRVLFGNIVGMPVNCNALIETLTEHLPPDPNIYLWVGAWRKGASWNHAKIIAVDGLYLHTGKLSPRIGCSCELVRCVLDGSLIRPRSALDS